MVKPEWGAKRTCPKCGDRFYDLGKDDPIICIECGNQWIAEPVLKSKQPIPFEEAIKKEEPEEADADLAATTIRISRTSTRTRICPTTTSILAATTISA